MSNLTFFIAETEVNIAYYIFIVKFLYVKKYPDFSGYFFVRLF